MVDRVTQTNPGPTEGLKTSVQHTMHEGVDFLRAEMRLLKAEMQESLREQISGVIVLAVAAVLGLIGLMLLAAAVAWFLAVWLGNPGWAFLIVAVAVLFIALVLFLLGRRRLSFDSLIPHRFIRVLNGLRFDLRERRHG